MIALASHPQTGHTDTIVAPVTLTLTNDLDARTWPRHTEDYYY